MDGEVIKRLEPKEVQIRGEAYFETENTYFFKNHR